MVRRILLVSLAGSLALVPCVLASPLAEHPFALRIEKPFVVHLKGSYGKAPEDATYTIDTEEREGRSAIHAVWDTSPIKTEFWLERGSGLPIETRYDKRKTGEKVEIRYLGGQEADYLHTKAGETRKSHVRAASTLYDSLALDVLLMGYPFESPKRIEFSIIDTDSDSGDTYEAYVDLVGKKKLRVGEREVECADILFALSGMVGLVGPKYHFFYETALPHRYVSYTGPDEQFTVTELVP